MDHQFNVNGVSTLPSSFSSEMFNRNICYSNHFKAEPLNDDYLFDLNGNSDQQISSCLQIDNAESSISNVTSSLFNPSLTNKESYLQIVRVRANE
jgi:hypothetical protein